MSTKMKNTIDGGNRMREEKKPYPVLYTTSTRGSLFRNGSVNKTLYFRIVPDEERLKTDPDYAGYYQEMMDKEIPQAIVNKFVISQPLLITNDRIPFLIFKSNLDAYSLQEFCKAIVQEFSFHTGQEHRAMFGLGKTMFAQIDKKPAFMLHPMGEKLTRSADFAAFQTPLEFEGEWQDQGIMCPFAIWKEEKRRAGLIRSADSDTREEIVEW